MHQPREHLRRRRCGRVHQPALGKYLRVEHEDNANTMGELAGRSMAGEPVSYDHLPFFYSDLFELGYETVGEVDSRLETVADWKETCREGVVYYMRGGRVRGALVECLGARGCGTPFDRGSRPVPSGGLESAIIASAAARVGETLIRQGDGMAAVQTPASERFAAGNRARAGTVKFSLAPTPPFRLDLAVWTLRRRVENGVDRWDGTTYRRVLPLGRRARRSGSHSDRSA